MKYFIDKDAVPPICVPSDLDLSKCLDVTVLGSAWRCYLDTSTGKLHDGKKYFKQMQEEFFSHPEAKTDHWY